MTSITHPNLLFLFPKILSLKEKVRASEITRYDTYYRKFAHNSDNDVSDDKADEISYRI